MQPQPQPSDPRAASPWSLAALVAANCIPLVGVLLFGWRIFDILILYWAESLVIGAINVLRMAVRLVLERDRLALILIPFFIFHYGMFCAVHGVFLYALFAPEAVAVTRAPNNWQMIAQIFDDLLVTSPGFGWSLAAIAASHSLSFVVNFLFRREYERTSAAVLMQAPYGRIVLLHLVVLLGGFTVQALGQPIYALVLMVVAKIVVDWRAHLRERTTFRAMRPTPPPPE